MEIRMLHTLRLWLSKVRFSPGARRVALAVSVIAMIVGVVVSIYRHPDVFREINWTPAVVALLAGIPLTVLLNALNFMITGRLVNKRFRLGVATEVAIVSTAANLLPLPGGPLTRAAALKGAGTGLREAGVAVLVTALLRAGTAFLYSGIWILLVGHSLLGAIFVTVGILVGAWSCGRLAVIGGAKLLSAAIAVQLGMILVDMGRIALCLKAVGEAGTIQQASALTVSGVAGSLVGIVPGGLGIREGVAAALGAVVSVPPAIAFLAAVINRIIGLTGITPVALLLALRRPSEEVETPTAESS